MKRESELALTRIKWLMTLRVVLVTSLLGLPLLLQLNYLSHVWSIPTFYFIIGSTYFLSIVYVFFMKRVENLVFFTSLQLGIDLLFETALITVTGGIESPFHFLYIITIVSASIFFYRKGGVLMAVGVTFLFGTLIHLQYAQFPPFNAGSMMGYKEVVYMLFLYMIAFFTVGILSGRLSDKLYEKEVGFSELRVFHEYIMQSISSGLITTNLAGTITSFNRSASEMIGFRPEEAIGKTWWELFSWDALQNHYRALRLAGTAQRFEGEIQNKRGERCLLGVTISALRNGQGDQIGVIGIFQDLTQLRNLEEEMLKKERLALIGEMAAGMAHEIRNPLASLSGSIEVLKSELRLSDENRKLMEIAVKEAERLNSIITQFLLYAKPLPPRRKLANLHALLSETVQLIKNSPEYNEQIQVILPADAEPLMISIDPDQMRQVFWNLSLNAFQAMPEGGTLTIATRRVLRKGGKGAAATDGVEIIFRDTGEGIRKEDLSKIFYPFFTTKSSGSGLGLAIVQRVIEEHWGDVEVESSPVGTAFLITLPMDQHSKMPGPEALPPDEEYRLDEKRFPHTTSLARSLSY